MKRIIVKAAGITLGVSAVLIVIGLVIVVAFSIPIPLPGGSTKNVDNPIPQEAAEARPRAGGTSPQVTETIEAFREEISKVKQELTSVRQELTSTQGDLNYMRGLVKEMQGSNRVLLQAVTSKSVESDKSAPPIVVMSPDRGETQVQQLSFDSEVFRVAVESVVAEALLSFYFPEETSPRDELDLLKRAFEKAVERLFVNSTEPLPSGTTLQTAFARSTSLNVLESRIEKSEGGIAQIGEALPKEEKGQYSKVARATDTAAAQKTADDVKKALEGLEKRLYDKDAVDTKVNDIYAAVEEVKTSIAVLDRACKNLGVAVAYCIGGHDYTKDREKALGTLYLIFGDEFRIKDVKKARGYAKKLTLPYSPIEEQAE